MESYSSTIPFTRLEHLPGWIVIQDPLKEKCYFYHKETQIVQWEYPTPEDIKIPGTTREIPHTASLRNQEVLNILRQDYPRYDDFGSLRTRIRQKKEEIIAVCSAFLESGCDASLLAVIFAHLVDGLEREREATVNRHQALGEFIRGKLEVIKFNPDLDWRSREKLLQDSLNVVNHISWDLPPPPPTPFAFIPRNLLSEWLPAPIASTLPDQVPPSNILTSAQSSSIQVNVANAMNADEARNASPLLECPAPEIHFYEHSTRGSIKTAKKSKQATRKDPEKFKHKCNTCGERFTRSTTLREHTRIHSGDRPFECSECGKKFPRSKDRNRHQALHSGGKTYLCGTGEWCQSTWGCGREFAREDQLAAHLRTQRGWECIKPILYDETLPRRLRGQEHWTGPTCCGLSSDACKAKFKSFEDFETHPRDVASKDCVAEWLVKQALKMGGIGRLIGNSGV